jgi:hypothetical protein
VNGGTEATNTYCPNDSGKIHEPTTEPKTMDTKKRIAMERLERMSPEEVQELSNWLDTLPEAEKQ